MLLERACDWLGWPDAQLVLDPKGEGAAVCAASVRQRIAEPLRRKCPGIVIESGILTADPNSAATSSPLAIICQFPSGASPEALQEAHRLAWNFSGSALLITLEPHRLMVWSCYQDPNQPENARLVCELPTSEDTGVQTTHQQQIRELLHWVSLITGDILRRHPTQFRAEGRADRLLLKNLRHIRGTLRGAGLKPDVCHDLLARIIFTQFLFHRKDSAGNAFFSKTLLAKRCEGALQREHVDLASILQDKDETYALFRWLDGRFNGDLFPGKENQTDAEREAAWQSEKDAVQPEHLQQLADLVSGSIDTTDQQLWLWPQYSFDTIPLEFISSIYEEFLNEDRDATKAYYTPSHLVDYVLDAVLPWEGDEWNLRILDPSCGSGIFLVKAFQRLIHRWRKKFGRDPLVRDLKPLLADNIYGVDYNSDAVRVACFSLYLAMVDAIDPKHYVTREKVFPRLRGTRLIANDFFDETTEGFRSVDDFGSFDLVLGNAPWGDGSVKETSDVAPQQPRESGRRKKKQDQLTKAEAWAANNQWPIANHDIGPLFIAKGLQLINKTGRVAMVQPAPPWLYQRANPAVALRKKLFDSFTTDEVTNLSAVRHELFPDVIGPACVMVVGRGEPAPDTSLYYFTPKPRRISPESTEIRIEPRDVSRITHAEAAIDPLMWSVLALGGQRDLQLIRRLQQKTNLKKLKAEGKVLTRMGVIPGDKQKPLPDLKDKPYFEATQFPDNVFLTLDADDVPAWKEPLVDSLHGIADYEEFKNPQLLIKQSYSTTIGRFRAALVRSSDPEWGVVCKETYLSVRDLSLDGRHIRAACLAYNSLIATYFLFLTSSRLGHYITEVPTNELVALPLPSDCPDLTSITSFAEIDDLARQSFGLTQADWIIIDDLIKIVLPDVLRKAPGPGRKVTVRKAVSGDDEPELSAYCHTFTRVLKSTFGKDRRVVFTIYQEPDAERVPVRMVTLHLDWQGRAPLTIEPIAANGLLDELSRFHRDVLSKKVRSANGEGLGFQRVAFFFHAHQEKLVRVQNLTVIKPDEYRYWTRSQAMRDADELAASIMKAADRKGAKR
ncbi:MAG TPA: N-6 DNA methylase [Polyangium sp.]|nr:N-6 DNA methylase [Polyangium sp.]